MKAFLVSVASVLASVVSGHALAPRAYPTGPFLRQVDNSTWVIGNELWNLTQGQTYGVKLYYKDHDCVGDAVGHYVSYSKFAIHSSMLLPPTTENNQLIICLRRRRGQ